MKFRVSRTSLFDKYSPCKEAIKENDKYYIEINTLEDLINFKKKYGDIIITDTFDNENIYELEIYDTYRE